MLQEDLQSLYNWSETWLLKFHPDKCKSVTITRNATNERTYHLFDENGNTVELEKTQGEKDIGVQIDSKLNFRVCGKNATGKNATGKNATGKNATLLFIFFISKMFLLDLHVYPFFQTK